MLNYICGSAGQGRVMSFTRALGGKSLVYNIRVGRNQSGMSARPSRHVLKTSQAPVRRENR